jgi:Tfp pilus assembly protein PilF
MVNSSNKYKILENYYPQILIVGFILLVYVQNLWFDLAYLDDGLIIYSDYEKINSLSKIPQAFLSGYLLDHYYRPIIIISFILDTAIAGQSSMMYHLTNILFHIVYCILLFNLLLKFKFEKMIALVFTIIFAVHPINTNAVSWIAGRNDLIVGVFSISSLLAFIKFTETTKTLWFVIHQFTFFLALYSKEIGIMVIPVIIIYILFFEKEFIKNKKSIILSIICWIGIIFSYLYLRLFIVNIHTEQRLGLLVLLNNLYIISEYLVKLIYLPAITPLSIKNSNLILGGIIISILILWLTNYLKLLNNKRALFGLIFFIVFIFPTLAVSQKTVSGEFAYLDCRIYLPFVGLIIFFSSMLEIKPLNFSATKFIVLSFIVYLIIFSFRTGQIYKNGKIFWTEVTKKYPEVASNWIGFGFYFFDNKNYLKAAELVEKAIKLRSDIPEFYHKAALAYENAGQLNKANEHLKSVLNLEKDKSITLVELIKNNLRLGNISDAIKYLNQFKTIEILDLKKKADLYSSLAYYFSYSGLLEYSVELMKQAVIYQPKNSTYINDLGVFYYNAGKIDSAKHFFYEALKLDPLNEDFQRNVNGLKNLSQ